jgi:hypothetical protein
MNERQLARTVLYRHACECATASRPLAEGEEPEHRLEFNGQPFPWHITEDGATITKLGDGLYTVRVEILVRDVDTDGPIEDGGPS